MSCCTPTSATTTTSHRSTDEQTIKDAVRERYGAAARATGSGVASGCGCGCGDPAAADPITADLYSAAETEGLPADAVRASLGCGNPTALAELRPGEVVLDLGSGGGLDVLLSARRVGPSGRAYGLDMTDEMLELARENQRRAGVANAEFLKGELENVPLPDGTVDVVISNCVVNLSPDKRRALAEAFRVLRPGGRFAVSDIVLAAELPERVRRSVEAWTGCIAGALTEAEYRRLLAEAGFTGVEVEPTRVFGAEDARAVLPPDAVDEAVLAEADGKVMSAFVRAVKPAA
ncbi:MAG TPA: arsenite methyltransferase [Thermoanaerobaculia bacterium]|nr:arsenite methyltransferase [Thermoanaerobaculia bacterium]